MRFVFNRDPIPQAGAPAVPYPSLALRSKALQPKRISHFQTDSVGFPAGRPKYSTSRTSNRHINSPFEHPYMYRLTLCPVAAALEDHAVATGHLKAGLKTHVFKTRDFKEENAVGF